MKIQEIIENTKSELKKYVAEDILDSVEEEEIAIRINEILENGCISGIVTSLMYYTDTEEFYDEFEDEIDRIVKDLDYQVKDYKKYKNELAWLAYEVMTDEIAADLGL